MTAGEDQPEPIVRNRPRLGHVGALVTRAEGRLVGEGVGACRNPPGAPDVIESATSDRGEKPGPRTVRRAFRGPMIERLSERLLGHFLGRVDVADDPERGGDQTSIFEAERARHAGPDAAIVLHLPGDCRSHGQMLPDAADVLPSSRVKSGAAHMCQTGLTSMKPPSASGIFFPHSTASSWLSHSMR